MANTNTETYEDLLADKNKAHKEAALNEVDVTYGDMISDANKYYQDQIDASKAWAQKQSQLQQKQTDFTIEQIEQQKEQTREGYTKEQSNAYVDWQKQSNEYGANAEAQAAMGMSKTGYRESSQVSMYNTYQNRLATARQSYEKAVQSYNNAITEARLQNNSALAQIAYNALQQQLELSLQGFQYKNALIAERQDRKTAIKDAYYQREQDILARNDKGAINKQPVDGDGLLIDKDGDGIFDDAINYLKANGASGAVDGLLDKRAWGYWKVVYQQYGVGDAAVSAFNTYEDYVNAYIRYATGGASNTIPTGGTPSTTATGGASAIGGKKYTSNKAVIK